MSSTLESFRKGSFFPSMPTDAAIPLTQTNPIEQKSLRRRLSALSVRIRPIPSRASSWAFRRSKSMSSVGESAESSIKKWWEWGLGWILSRKLTFAKDVEMNEGESTAMLGRQNKGSWRHVFYKARSEFRKLMGSDRVGLPQTYRYDSFSYAQNFDNGNMCH